MRPRLGTGDETFPAERMGKGPCTEDAVASWAQRRSERPAFIRSLPLGLFFVFRCLFLLPGASGNVWSLAPAFRPRESRGSPREVVVEQPFVPSVFWFLYISQGPRVLEGPRGFGIWRAWGALVRSGFFFVGFLRVPHGVPPGCNAVRRVPHPDSSRPLTRVPVRR